MSNRGEFVGTAPTSGNYIPAPTPAEQEDLPVYINDELLRLGGVVNGVLEGGSLPPHSELPKRYKEGMIMNFSSAVGDGVDSSGVWLYKKAKWWKLIDDPTTITDEIYEKIAEVEKEISDAEADIKHLNEVTLPEVKADLAQANQDLAELDGKFPIGETDIKDNSISTPKLQANSVNADKILANSITGDKIVANSITGDKIKANSISADKIVANSITGDKIKAGTEINAPIIKGAKIESIGTNYMKISSGEPFGPNNLIEWYGLKAGNISGGNPIYANLRKSNAITYVDDEGSPYFGGVFKAGVLENAGSTSLKTATPEREIDFTSNGGSLDVAVSFSFSASFVGPTSGPPSSVICPVNPTMDVVTGTVFLESWDGSNWVLLTQQPVTGDYNCSDGEYNGESGGTSNQGYFSSTNSSSVFTFTDTTGGLNRKLRVRATLNNWFYSTQSSQVLSIISSE